MRNRIFKYHNKNSFAIIPGDSKYLSLIQKLKKLVKFLHLVKIKIVIQNSTSTMIIKFHLQYLNKKLILKKNKL